MLRFISCRDSFKSKNKQENKHELQLIKNYIVFEWVSFVNFSGSPVQPDSITGKLLNRSTTFFWYVGYLQCCKASGNGSLREVTKHGVISGPYFPVFGLNTEIYFVNLRIQSEYRKIRTRNNSVFGHFSRTGFQLDISPNTLLLVYHFR